MSNVESPCAGRSTAGIRARPQRRLPRSLGLSLILLALATPTAAAASPPGPEAMATAAAASATAVDPAAGMAGANAAAPADTADSTYALIAEALAGNALLQAEAYSVAAAEQGLAAARAQRAPQLALNARYTVAAGGRTFTIPTGDLVNPIYRTLNQLTAGQPGAMPFPMIDNQQVNFLRRTEQDTRLGVTAPIYAPQLDARIALRRAELAGAVASREAYARTLVRDLRQAHARLAQADAAVGILDASVATLDENRRVAAALLDAGRATRDRLLRAEAEWLAVRQQRDAADNDRRQAQRYLNLLRNREADAPVPGLETALLPPADALAGDHRQRPELDRIDAGIDAAEAGARAARAGYRPTLAFVADTGVQGTSYAWDRDSDVSTASLVVSWALFDAGARRAEAAQANAQASSLRASRDDLRRRLELAARDADDRAGTARRAVRSAEARVAAADEAFRIAERKRDAGQLTLIEFLDAERARTEARLGQVIARADLLAATAEQEYARAAYPLPAFVTASPTP